MSTLLEGIRIAEKINQSQLNQSPSKAMYSFPKESRFKAPSKQRSSSSNIGRLPPKFSFQRYQPPPKLDEDEEPPKKYDHTKRSTSFGYGSKYDFTKQCLENPAPNAYKKVDGLYHFGNFGVSFGFSREKVKFNGSDLPTKEKRPGPGQYSLSGNILKHSFSKNHQKEVQEEIRKSMFTSNYLQLIYRDFQEK